jgi:hypothetical protein
MTSDGSMRVVVSILSGSTKLILTGTKRQSIRLGKAHPRLCCMIDVKEGVDDPHFILDDELAIMPVYNHLKLYYNS